MRSKPEKILKEVKRENEKINPILFYGNEGGLISKLIKSIYNILHSQVGLNEIKKFDYTNHKNESLDNLLNSPSLFSKVNLIVLTNPKESLIRKLENIENIENNKNVLIINGEGIATKSKIKKYFDNHRSFLSVPCYSLDRNTIKKIVDEFLTKNNISLQSDAYFFLIENISEEYLILENELLKLLNFKKNSATIEDITKLIIQKNNYKADSYFFHCANGNYKLIIKDINSSVKSITDSYEILGSIKKFIEILSSATTDKKNYNLDDLVTTYLPKYLFMKKEIFREILKKISIIKITEKTKLLQKTELLLRKNPEQHKEIIERFLLNLTKIMK